MDTPQPITADRLASILKGAKNVMKKVESGNFTTGNVDPSMFDVDGTKLQEGNSRMMGDTIPKPARIISPEDSNYINAVNSSRMPDAIKKAMIEKPIVQMTSPSHTFKLEDVANYMDDDKPMGRPKINPRPSAPTSKRPQRQFVTETQEYSSDYVTVSRDELAEMVNEIVNERLLEFFVHNHNKRVTEDAVKKTINVLIKEGKIPKKA